MPPDASWNCLGQLLLYCLAGGQPEVEARNLPTRACPPALCTIFARHTFLDILEFLLLSLSLDFAS